MVTSLALLSKALSDWQADTYPQWKGCLIDLTGATVQWIDWLLKKILAPHVAMNQIFSYTFAIVINYNFK